MWGVGNRGEPIWVAENPASWKAVAMLPHGDPPCERANYCRRRKPLTAGCHSEEKGGSALPVNRTATVAVSPRPSCAALPP